MSEAENSTHSTRGEASDDAQEKPRINWADPDVPAGNAPPLPSWPFAVALVCWLGWIGFLLSTALGRMPSS
jgi:hypothetical protein